MTQSPWVWRDGLVVVYLLPLVDALERAGWRRTRRTRAAEWWALPDEQRIRVEFEGAVSAVGRYRARTMEFLLSIDTSSDDAVARAAGCWTDAQISAVRSAGWKIYLDEARSPAERAEGLYGEIQAVYQRDRRAWAMHWRVYQEAAYATPPDEATYAAHWLTANGHRFDPAVVAVLRQRYPAPATAHIRPGSSVFHPRPQGGTPQRLA